MSIPPRYNNENFRLLDLSSSDADTDELHFDISRKKKVTRKGRNRGVAAHVPDNSGSELICAVRWITRGSLFIWLLILSWLTVTLYDQITSMNGHLIKVTTSSEGVGDELQLCHTAAKELRANASDLSAKLSELERAHIELVKRVDGATKQLASVSEQLGAAPQLADTPRRLAELQRVVADIGSQISGFDGVVKSAKKQAVAATTGLDEVKTAFINLEARTNETIANSTINSQKEDELRQQISALNATFVARLDTLQGTIAEATKTTSTPAPTSPTTVKPTSTSSTTTTPTPDLAAKPTATE